jgi:DNA-directed RNA polymerase specialized sigma24 family protein
MSRDTDEDVLRRALSGDRTAFDELALRLGPVLSVCARRFRRKTGASADERDLVQVAWEELCRADMKTLRAWSEDKGASLGTYVQRVAWRKWSHLLKKGGGGVPVADVEPDELHALGPTVEEDVGGREVVAQFEQWLWPQLALKGQLIARYIYRDGMTPAETAGALGVTVTVVNNWTFKIRTLARKYFGLADE